MKSVDIGIIGALDKEVEILVESLEGHEVEAAGSVEFHTGRLFGRSVAVARCGVGKVFAAICAQTMIIKYSPKLIVNTGVGGALASSLAVTDTVIADRLVQHDMDTSAIGDPKGLVSGINKVWFETDKEANGILSLAAEELGIRALTGAIASGDKFIASADDKKRIVDEFGACACEMEGAAIAQTAYVNGVRFAVIRAISDTADESSGMTYQEFMPIAARNSARLALALVKNIH